MSFFKLCNRSSIFKNTFKNIGINRNTFLNNIKFNFSSKEIERLKEEDKNIKLPDNVKYIPIEQKTQIQINEESKNLQNELLNKYGSKAYFERAKILGNWQYYAKRRRLTYLNSNFRHSREHVINVIRFRTNLDNCQNKKTFHEVFIRIAGREDNEELNFICKYTDIHGLLEKYVFY
jgi:hypothetical protein